MQNIPLVHTNTFEPSVTMKMAVIREKYEISKHFLIGSILPFIATKLARF